LENQTINPFTKITREKVLDFGGNGKFKAVLYKARRVTNDEDVMIEDPKHNGIAVIDVIGGHSVLEDYKKKPVGTCIPGVVQNLEFDNIAGLDWKGFKSFVNSCPSRIFDV
jgi:hypothetical protein